MVRKTAFSMVTVSPIISYQNLVENYNHVNDDTVGLHIISYQNLVEKYNY